MLRMLPGRVGGNGGRLVACKWGCVCQAMAGRWAHRRVPHSRLRCPWPAVQLAAIEKEEAEAASKSKKGAKKQAAALAAAAAPEQQQEEANGAAAEEGTQQEQEEEAGEEQSGEARWWRCAGCGQVEAAHNTAGVHRLWFRLQWQPAGLRSRLDCRSLFSGASPGARSSSDVLSGVLNPLTHLPLLGMGCLARCRKRPRGCDGAGRQELAAGGDAVPGLRCLRVSCLLGREGGREHNCRPAILALQTAPEPGHWQALNACLAACSCVCPACPALQMKMPQLMPQAEAFLQTLQGGMEGRLHPYHARVIGKQAPVCCCRRRRCWCCRHCCCRRHRFCCRHRPCSPQAVHR